MDAVRLLSFFSFFFSIFLAHTVLCVDICSPSSCSGTRPQVQFPFRLTDRHDYRCGYPSFDLSCNQTQTVLNLPFSGDFIVKRIDYPSQSIYINDPDFCLPKRILSLNLWGSLFRGLYLRNFTFFNCTSSEWSEYNIDDSVPLNCLGGDNYTVIAMAYPMYTPPGCRNISTVSVPVQYDQHHFGYMDLKRDLQLTWDVPDCRACVTEGGTCGFKSNSGTNIGCSNLPRHGLPRSAKYGIIIGALIPGLVCIIGLACYICNWIKAYGRRRQLNTELATSTTAPQLVVVTTGLDATTIESYPKTVLGDNQQLPKPNDGTCPICLSDYQAKETIRTIPECKHYFHANCIDEWLRMNATCPLCRNTPDGSSMVTPLSSISSSPLSSSSSSSSTS